MKERISKEPFPRRLVKETKTRRLYAETYTCMDGIHRITHTLYVRGRSIWHNKEPYTAIIYFGCDGWRMFEDYGKDRYCDSFVDYLYQFKKEKS